MEADQENMKKKNMTIKIVSGAGGGGGLAGIILLGGAVATAALVSVFAFKRKQHLKSKKINQIDSTNKAQDNELVGEGLAFLVPDSSSSPQFNHQNSSSGTADTRNELGSEQVMILDETSKINGEEIHLPYSQGRTRDSPLCDESSISTEKLLQEAEKAVKKNNSLEEVDEQTTVDSNQVDEVENDREVTPSRREVSKVCIVNRDIIDGLNKELVEAAQTEVNGKAHQQGEECDGNGKIIFEEILVRPAQSDQLEGDDNFNKLVYECVGNGMIVAENKEKSQVETLVNQIKIDDNSQNGGNECVDYAGLTIDKCEELVEEIVAANGIPLSEEPEATTYRDQEIVCSDRNKAEFFIPVIDSSSPKHGTDDLAEDLQVMKGDEVIGAAVLEDDIELKDRAQTQLIEAVEDDTESHSVYKENTSEKCEEGDQIVAKDEQQMKPCEEGDQIVAKVEQQMKPCDVGNQIAVIEEQQMQPCEENWKTFINGDREMYLSDNVSPKRNSFQCNGFKVQEFTFRKPDSSSLSIKNDSAETALLVEALKPLKNDGTADEVFADQIILENKPLVQSSENDTMEHSDNGNDNAAAEGEALETGQKEVQEANSGEAEDCNDDRNNDEEAVKTIQTDNFEAENNLHLIEDNEYDDTVGTEGIAEVGKLQSSEEEEDEGEEDTDIDCNEEDNVHEVEESSKTTGDSSLDSTADVIWPAESVLVQEFSQKEMQANNQNFKEVDIYVNFNSHKLKEGNKDKCEMASTKTLTTGTRTLKQPTNSLNLKIWLFSLLLPILLLLWLASSPPIVTMSE